MLNSGKVDMLEGDNEAPKDRPPFTTPCNL